ncbi:hypothetical protein CDAR_70281 [Caerostris darwini]|uniref:Uncharacterized protein n=1 Tax=Caerostris darwini TaxID=1538125 RepID=A0AAV4PUL8_9ARAC|nr:hypothetical protein CDAR_70281 [Caerostris darwini]
MTRIATGTAIQKPGKEEGVGMKSFSNVRAPVFPSKVNSETECSRSCWCFSCNLWEVVLYASHCVWVSSSHLFILAAYSSLLTSPPLLPPVVQDRGGVAFDDSSPIQGTLMNKETLSVSSVATDSDGIEVTPTRHPAINLSAVSAAHSQCNYNFCVS